MSGNKEANKKIAAKRLAKDPLTFVKMGALGGAKSSNRPLRDPERARELARIRWEKYKKRLDS